MEIIRLSSCEYSNLFKEFYHIYNSAIFTELNQNNAEEIFYLVFKDTKPRLGIILGRRGNVLYSPFSASFGGFSYSKPNVSISQIENAISLLSEYALRLNYSVKISLPPFIYENNFIAKQTFAFFRSQFSLLYCDQNYSFNLTENNEYTKLLWKNAKKNLNTALAHQFSFEKANTSSEIELAYSIIKANRDSKGYPLKMSLDKVLETIKIINADFFNLYYNKESIASAQVFHTSKGIVQIIYWGDKPGFDKMRPMNFLAFKIWEYYKSKGIQHIDIGPSSENGIPNYGLCEFKESIGCSITNKLTFFYKK